MKRTLFFFLIAFAATLVTGERTPFQVQRALNDAVIRERQAIARYEAFAAKAELEGYLGVASLFRANAKAEGVHLSRFSGLMSERGLPLPIEEASSVKVGTTRQNLDDSIVAEHAERDGVYLEAINACTSNHDQAAAKVFDETRDVEVEHANLCVEANRRLDQMKDAKEYSVCSRCGYTTDLRLGFCPLCRQAAR